MHLWHPREEDKALPAVVLNRRCSLLCARGEEEEEGREEWGRTQAALGDWLILAN